MLGSIVWHKENPPVYKKAKVNPDQRIRQWMVETAAWGLAINPFEVRNVFVRAMLDKNRNAIQPDGTLAEEDSERFLIRHSISLSMCKP